MEDNTGPRCPLKDNLYQMTDNSLSYTDPGVTPRKQGFPEIKRISKKQSRNFNVLHTEEETESTELIHASH